MRSETSKRILSETSEEKKQKVRETANKLVMRTIHNVYVKVESQEQLDKLILACDNFDLDTWGGAFMNEWIYFRNLHGEFWNIDDDGGFEQVTESEFMELLKKYKDGI